MPRAWTLALVLLAGLGGSPSVLAAEIEVEGRVLGPDRRGLGNASVELRRIDPRGKQALRDLALLESPAAGASAERTTRAASDGSYSMSAPPGVWEIRVSSRGHSERCLTVLPLVETLHLPTVALDAAGSLEVTVVDPDGKPLSGALVRTRSEPRLPNEWGECRQQARTGDDGVAVLERAVRRGGVAVTLEVYRPEFREARQVVAEDGRVALEPAPRQDVVVWLDDPSAAEGGPPAPVVAVAGEGRWPVARSDDKGRLVLPAVPGPPGGFQLLSLDGREVTLRLADRPAEGPWRVPLPPTRVLTGKTREVLVDEAGEMTSRPVSGAIVWDAHEPGNWVSSARDGRYRVLNAEIESRHAEPALHLVALASGYRPTEIDMALPPPTEAGGPDGRRLIFDQLDFWLSSAEALQSVMGRLVDSQEQPVAGADVRLLASASSTAQARISAALASTGVREEETLGVGRSDAEGVFRLTAHPGRKSLVVLHAEMAPAVFSMVEVSRSQDAVDVGTFVLTPGWQLEGIVTDSLGEPLPGAAVELAYPAHDVDRGTLYPVDRRRQPVVADSEGVFRLHRLPERAVALRAHAPGYVPSIVPLRPESTEQVIVALEKVSSLAGRVLEEAGEPVADAEIRLIPDESMVLYGASVERSPEASTRSDPGGRFKLENLPPGSWRLSVDAAGFAPSLGTALETAPGEDLRDIEVRLRRGVELSGRLVTRDGLPVFDGLVQVADQRTLSERDGVFRFPQPLSPGQVLIQADHEDYGLAEELLTLTPTETHRQIELVLEPGLSIDGHVLDPEGRPVSGAWVKLAPSYPVAGDYSTTDDRGRFQFRNVRSGRYTVSGRGQAGTGRLEVVVAHQPVTDLELTLHPLGLVRGRVTGLGDTDLRRVLVECKTPDGLVGCSRAVDGTGSFEQALPLGSWSLVASLGGSDRTATQTIVLTPEQPETDARLRFGPAETLQGRLIHNDRPLINAEIRVLAGGATAATTWTDWQGGFSLERIVGASILEAISETRDFRVRFPIDRVETGPVRIETRALTGTVVTPDGSSLRYKDLALVPLGQAHDGQTPSAAGFRLLKTDAEGAFALRRVPVGRYRLEALDRGTVVSAIQVEVGDDAVASVRFVLAIPPPSTPSWPECCC